MQCNEIRDRLLTDYLDGLLVGELKGQLATHLEGCPTCRSLLVAAREAMEPFKQAERLEPPPHIWEAVRARLERGKKPSRPRFGKVTAWLRSCLATPEPALALDAIVSVVLTATLFLKSGDHYGTVPFNAGAQADYLISLLDNGSIPFNGDAQGFGTPIEEYFL